MEETHRTAEIKVINGFLAIDMHQGEKAVTYIYDCSKPINLYELIEKAKQMEAQFSATNELKEAK